LTNEHVSDNKMDKIKIEIHDVSNGGNSRFSLNAGNPNNQQI
jgi:hypothetical protein